MPEQIVYLDSGAIVKRYIKEGGSETVDKIFENAERSNTVIFCSFWCIGEVVGVFDRHNRIGDAKLDATLGKFSNEMERLSSRGAFRVINVGPELIFEAMQQVLKHHIYISDALQIATSKSINCDKFLTSDRALNTAARKEGINSVLVI
jgi:uncharacterized protein